MLHTTHMKASTIPDRHYLSLNTFGFEKSKWKLIYIPWSHQSPANLPKQNGFEKELGSHKPVSYKPGKLQEALVKNISKAVQSKMVIQLLHLLLQNYEMQNAIMTNMEMHSTHVIIDW